MEIEAKYAIPSEQVFHQLQAQETLGAFQLRESGAAALHDTYLDTADRAVWQAGYALRLREKGDACMMTLKALAGGAGPVKRREELEVTLPQPMPPTLWPPSAIRERLLEVIGDQPLQPLFDLHQLRHERTVMAGERAVCLMSLDAVTLTGEQRRTQFFVLEAELLPDGTEQDLAAIMQTLQEAWQLQPDTETKLQRALDFFGLTMPELPETRLTPTERRQLTAIAQQPTMYGRRAQAVLLLDEGVTQLETAGRVAMSERRVRYWLAEWRQKRLGIFPEKVLTATTSAPLAVEVPAAADEIPARPAARTVSAPPPSNSTPAEAVDVAHLHAVADLADKLFELLQPWHGLPDEDRALLREIALLHDCGLSVAPEQHDTAGYGLLEAQPPAQLTAAEAQLAALATLLHSQRLKSKTLQQLLDHSNFNTLPPEQQHRALVLAALLRLADGLDFRHSGSTQIASLKAGQPSHGEIVITVTGPVAGSDAERANLKADLWGRLFNQPVRFQTPPLNSTELLAQLLHLPTDVLAPESLSLPATPGINIEDPLVEAARKTFLFHFQRMLFLEPQARLGEDNEALHEMRVATRRMRVAAQVFAAYLDNETLRPYFKGLRCAGDKLGAVRDLDVFWEKTEAFLQSRDPADRPDLTPLYAVWRQAREQAREQLLAYLDSRAYRRFRERFAAHLEFPWAPPTSPFNERGEALPQRVREVAPILIMERVAAVRAFDPWVHGADVPLTRLHRLRIASKRLRYTLEYFAEVLGPAAKTLITQVKLLQDHLGELQDAVVASALLRDFLVWGTWGPPPSATLPLEPVVAPGVAAYLTARQVELQQRREEFLPLWESFTGPDFSRLVAEVIAAL
ncbi:MAG: CHAD domain protein [Chloroflexi bacterium ADurb.Bin222]|nr:MAG: CHAD domain protein [Chloroflexi bacterium ADurb.Bin222]